MVRRSLVWIWVAVVLCAVIGAYVHRYRSSRTVFAAPEQERSRTISHAELRGRVKSQPLPRRSLAAKPAPLAQGDPFGPTASATEITPLLERKLALPVDGMKMADIQDTFDQARPGERKHEASDILAPRGTPVRAVEDGIVKRLFLSKAGGITVYQFDPSEHYCYYYAHLDRYAEGLKEGDEVKRGDLIGYVGTTGNAPPGTPHLHFAIFALNDDKHWWEGEAINPYPVLKATAERLGLR